MGTKEKKCFVCEFSFNENALTLNTTVNMYVCLDCLGTENEKQKETEMLDSLADGLVCGCI